MTSASARHHRVHGPVQVARPVDAQRPEQIDAHDVARPGLDQDPRHRDTGRAQAHDHGPQVLDPPPRQLQRVQQCGQHDDGRPVLIVVEHGDVQQVDQAVFDLEAPRGGDVLEVDATEPGADRVDHLDDLVGVARVQTDREGVHAGELLEQHRLALHHRHGRPRADVAETEHGGPVGHDGDRAAPDRVLEGLVRVGVDHLAHARHAGRVRHRQVIAGLQRLLVANLDLAAEVQLQGPVGGVEHPRARQRVHRLRSRGQSEESAVSTVMSRIVYGPPTATRRLAQPLRVCAQ